MGERTNYQLVLVEWVDSARGDGWVTLDHAREDNAHTVRSVGWLIHDTAELICVAPHHSDETTDADEQVSGHMKIPKRCITKMHALADPSRG